MLFIRSIGESEVLYRWCIGWCCVQILEICYTVPVQWRFLWTNFGIPLLNQRWFALFVLDGSLMCAQYCRKTESCLSDRGSDMLRLCRLKRMNRVDCCAHGLHNLLKSDVILKTRLVKGILSWYYKEVQLSIEREVLRFTFSAYRKRTKDAEIKIGLAIKIRRSSGTNGF